MRIFTPYFQFCLFLVISFSAAPIYGSSLTNQLEKENLLPQELTLPDTTCGLTDTVVQLTFPTCIGDADATARIQIDGASGPLSIIWDNETRGATGTNLSVGKHFVTVTDLDGCMLIDSIIIADKLPFAYDIQTVAALCNGVPNGRITLSDTAAYQYNWSTGDTLNSISNLEAGIYTVTITDTLGCTASETLTISNSAQAILEIDGTNASCFGINNGTVSVNDTSNLAGYSYLWSTGDTTNTIADLQPGTYFVQSTSPEGCQAADSINIGIDREVPLIANITSASCAGVNNGAITINDTLDVTGFQFGWSNGETTQSIDSLPAGVYSVAIADSMGCIAAAAIEVTNATQLTFTSAVTNATCDVAENGSIIINDSTDVTGFAFNWSTGESTQTLDNIVPAIYSVTVTDSTGCTATDSIEVGITPDLAISFSVENTTCDNLNDGSITINEGADISNLTITWNTADSTQSITDLAPGTYTFLVTDAFGCSVSGEPVVEAGTTFSLTSTVTDATCTGVNDGNIVLTDTLGLADLTVVWNRGDTTENLVGLAPGTYSYVATDNLGCTQRDTFLIGTQKAIALDLDKTDISCEGLSDGALMVTNNADVNTNFVWSTNDSTQNISSLGTGTYSVTATDSEGCIGSQSITLFALNSISISLSQTSVSCTGLMDGTVTVNQDSTINGLDISWSTGDRAQSVTGLGIGTYSATVTDSTGCIAIDSIEIVADSSLQIGLTGNNINCVGIDDGRINASVIGRASNEGLTFLWSNNVTTEGIANLAPGNYNVTVTDTTGCFGTGGVNLNPADTVQILLTTVQPGCMDTVGTGAIITDIIGGSGNFNYNWNTGDTTSAIGQLLAGTYVLTVTDSLGCIHIDSTTLVNPPNLIVSANATQAATCEGTSDGIADVVVSGGTSPYSILWDTDTITPTLSNLNPGTYTVSVSDAAGCQVTERVVIEQTTNIELAFTELSSASDANTADAEATVSINGGLAPYTINWDNGAIGDTVNNLSPGLHEVIVTDANGCTASGSIEIGFFELNISIIEVRNLRCNGANNGRATASPSTGISPFIYSWNSGDTTAILTNIPGGQYAVTVTDAAGKRGKATVTITEPVPIRFNLTITPPNCSNTSNGRIIINPTGVVGNPLYEFGFGVSNDPRINGVSAGVKRIGLLDGNGCRADTTFTLEALSPGPPNPVFGVETLGLIATFSDSSTNEPNSYLWNFGDGTTSMEVSPIHEYADTGDYEVCLMVMNSCGTDSLCQMVRVNPIPVPGVDLIFGRDTSALSGQIVSIPVTVGAFDDVAAISGTFELTNPALGSIQAVRSLNLPNLIAENISFQQNLINIDWQASDTSSLVSLPIGTQIFIIDVLLTGGSDECSNIRVANSESPIQFTKIFNGQLVPAPFNIRSAEICIAQTVSIAGNISREEATAIAGVTVTTNGDATFTTGNDGNYSLPGLPGGTTFNITPTKSDDLLAGVTAFDLVRILQHILTQAPLDSPYKVIAADVDNSGSVTSLDLVHLQRLILGQIDAFPNNQPWRFVAQGYVFTNPSNPLGENFPETIELTRLEIDTANVDFVAIKVGDVIGAANVGTARFAPKSMGFQIEEQIFKAGDLVTIPFNMEPHNNGLGFQVEIDFDHKKLAFKEATKGNYLQLSQHNLGVKDIEYGRLKLLWVNQQQLALRPSNKGLFQLAFIALQDGTLSEVLNIAKDQFPAQFYSKDGQQIGIQNIELAINNKLSEEEEIETVSPNTLTFMQGGENTSNGGCGDGIDNDMDGLIDCADADCFCECNTSEDEGNLIVNPSAESTLNIEGGWEMILGNWETRGSNPSPQEGAAYFYPLDSDLGQLSQFIDLSKDSTAIDQGVVTYIFTGYTRSFDQEPSDEGQIIIEYRNANDSTVLRFDSGLLTNLTDWVLVGDTTLAPSGTRSVIINLIARRKNGTNNDAYFDNLSLLKMIDASCVEPCAEVDLLTLTTEATINGNGGTANATLVGGIGPITYNWSNGDSINEISNLPAGAYTVIATDSIGCTAMDSLEIFADSSFFANLIAINNNCFGENNGAIGVEINGGTAPFTLVWNDTTLSGDNLQGLSDGDYSLTITDSTNAVITLSATISSGSQISLSSTDSKIVDESCPNVGDGQLSLVASGGTAPYNYIIGTDTTDNGVYLNLNAGTYTVNITDDNGCSVSNDIVIGNMTNGTLSANFTAAIDDQTVNLSSASNDTLATYSWTFGDGTTSAAMNPSVTYVTAGAYEVCLTITNDCGTTTSCQTLTVGVNGPVTFIVNGVNGIASDTVIIPITVQNFVDIVSYQKTIQIQDTTIARFVGVSSQNLDGLTADNFFQIDDYTITNVWFDATGLGKSVANNTAIYNLMVMVDSSVDTCIGISIVNNPVSGQVAGIMGNEITEVPFETVNGEICTKESVQITGNIARETGTVLPGVQLAVSNLATNSTTDANGDYLVDKLTLGTDYEITPTLNTDLLENVSTFDIVLINRHILGTGILDSPYKIIAADVNSSGGITVFDLVLIQRAILRLNDNFPGNNSWRFIPKSYQFADASNPLAEDFPESIDVTNLTGNVTNQDFIAIKVADVSYNVSSAGLASNSRTSQTLDLEIENQTFKAGELIEVPVSAADLNTAAGFQLELDFDRNSLELVAVNPVELKGFDQNNIGVQYLNQGKVQMIWVAPVVEMHSGTTTLFNLQFKTKASGDLTNKLQLANRFLTSESYSKDLTIGNLTLTIKETSLRPLTALSVFPNPTKGLVDLNFSNEHKASVQIALYNFTGQLVKEWTNVTDDYLQINLNNQADGTYLIVLKRATDVEVKRVVLNR